MKKSWKTTAAGMLAAFGTWASKQHDPAWLPLLGDVVQMLGVFLLGLVARDKDVTSEGTKVPSAQ